jgi:hypothetical protein
MNPPIFSGFALVVLASAACAQNAPPSPVSTGVRVVDRVGGIGDGPAEPRAPEDPTRPEELREYDLERYERIVEKSPFNFKIHRREPGPEVSFADDLALAGVTRDLGKGIEYATIVDKKTNERFVINSRRPNDEGILLVRSKRADTLLETSVIARKGDEEEEIKAEKEIVERKAVVAAGVSPAPQKSPAPTGSSPRPRRVVLPPPVAPATSSGAPGASSASSARSSSAASPSVRSGASPAVPGRTSARSSRL